jgi:hypothetical protein
VSAELEADLVAPELEAELAASPLIPAELGAPGATLAVYLVAAVCRADVAAPAGFEAAVEA